MSKINLLLPTGSIRSPRFIAYRIHRYWKLQRSDLWALLHNDSHTNSSGEFSQNTGVILDSLVNHDRIGPLTTEKHGTDNFSVELI